MIFTPSGGGPRVSALALRTGALVILLYQLRLLAADMADTPFFIAALAGALGTAVFLNRKKINKREIRSVEALVIIALIPWIIRLFIALPRWFIPGGSGGSAIFLDSLLLNLDRNNFTALLPFYWTAVSSYFSIRSRVFLRVDIIAADFLFVVLFSIAPTAGMNAYRWPILMIGIFSLVLFLQILSLILSSPPELKLGRKEGILAGSFLFLLVFSGGVFFIRPFQERAVEKGGGLLEPKLFRFDFSQFIKLESEISVSDDLVLIVKKEPGDEHNLLRRYTLSGYNPGQGFTRLEDIDEAAHPRSLPGSPIRLPSKEIKNYRESKQEYYLVNFDAEAFIGMNTPVEITPFETWDTSSFNSAYAVTSHTSEAYPFELIDALQSKPGPENLKMSAEEYALYTNYGNDEEIASFSRKIITDAVSFARNKLEMPSYWEQIQIIYERLKYGEYRYSLKPGIAPNGDQLKYFLFSSKKGYCSYYAFAFALMLRSLGIPSRVAAGFAVDTSTETFNYYPVRQDMAHAWVEVWFPEYGWIEYDPTSNEVAEGEEYRFSEGTPRELFERLMKEILSNHSQLKIKEKEETETENGNLAALGRKTLSFVARKGPFLAAVILIFLFLALRSGFLRLSTFCGNPRKKVLYLWAHAKRRLALAGLGRFSPAAHTGQEAIGEAEWAKALDEKLTGGFYSLYLAGAAARFAPDFTYEDSLKAAEHYRLFNKEYRKAIPAARRFLAWLLPPLALILPAPRSVMRHTSGPDGKNDPGNRGGKTAGAVLLIIVLFLLRGETGGAQDEPAFHSRADMLYENALEAAANENWERAVALFSTGINEHPLEARFPWSLGNLYYYRRLYRLAWNEYRRAEEIILRDIPPSAGQAAESAGLLPDLLYQLANTAGYLSHNKVSADYLERFLALEPDNKDAIGSLAWMYFKLHRLPEGEQLLLDAMKRMGQDAHFCMTLGTIYSDMFQYPEAKDFYLKAVAGAEAAGDKLFAALAHYNLSILESRFYEFGLAYSRTAASLEAMDRSSGRFALGELYLRRMELSRALAEYQDANSRTDSPPLSKLNLAEVFQTGGRLTEAALYAKDCLKAGDESWMLTYGIDPVRYKRDIHEILKNTYEGLMKAEAFSSPGTLKERLQSFFRAVSYRFYFGVHSHLYRKYSLIAANAYDVIGGNAGGGILVEAMLQYYNAFEAYPRRALSYLKTARNLEEPLIPGSTPSYDFEEGRLLKERNAIEETLTGFDPLWERDMAARVYAELALSGKKALRLENAERLFALNRGGLLRNGIRLPVNLRIDAGRKRERNLLEKAAAAAGIEAVKSVGPEKNTPRYSLTLGLSGEGTVSCELYDGGRGITIFKQNLPLPELSSSRRAAFSRALRDEVFNAF